MSTDSVKIEENQKSDMDAEDSSDEEIETNYENKSSNDSEQNRFQRRHFSNKTSSNIFFCDMSTEDNASSGNAGVDRRELFYPSAGHDTRYAGQKQLEKRHFCSPSESANQDEQVNLNGTAKLTKVETDGADQTQRHQVYEKTSSDIFFRNLPTDGKVSSGSSKVDREELSFPSAGHYTHYADQDHGERRHFDSPSDDHMQQESNINQDKQIDSSKTVELTKVERDGDVQKQTQRHQVYEKTSSDIFFRNPPTEGKVSSGSAKVDREELLFPSAGHYTHYADQKHGERQHFHSPSDDHMQQESNINQDKQIDSSETVKLTKVERDGGVQNQRHQVYEKTSSDIFFRNPPTEGKISSGSAKVDREELSFPSAGHYTHYADEKHGERRHYPLPSDDHMQQESNINQDKQIDSPETVELTNVERDGGVQNQTQRHQVYVKTSSDIFFRNPPTEDNVSSGCTNVDREELIFPSAGHFTRFADQEHGERQHFRSPSEDYVQSEDDTNQDKQVDSSEEEEVVEDGADENKTQRHHFHDKTSSDIFCNLPARSNASSGSASVDREELMFPSAGHFTRYVDPKEGEKRHFHLSSAAVATQ